MNSRFAAVVLVIALMISLAGCSRPQSAAIVEVPIAYVAKGQSVSPAGTIYSNNASYITFLCADDDIRVSGKDLPDLGTPVFHWSDGTKTDNVSPMCRRAVNQGETHSYYSLLACASGSAKPVTFEFRGKTYRCKVVTLEQLNSYTQQTLGFPVRY